MTCAVPRSATCLLVGVLAAGVLGAAPVRAAGFRAPVAARRVGAHATAASDATLLDLRHRLELSRLFYEIGDDWSEVLIAVESDARLADVLEQHGGQWRARGTGRNVVKVPRGADKFEWYLGLRGDPEVLWIEPNYDSRLAGCRQMSLDILESGGARDLNAQVALQSVGGSTSLPAPGVIVAIVDSGVAEIPELDGRLLPAIDLFRGHANRSIDPNGHGTAMASLVATLAEDAWVLPVRVVREDCTGTLFELAEGIRQAADAGADVIAVSLGTVRYSAHLTEAVAYATASGALVVAAAGNDGYLESPASLPGVIAVTALDDAGWLAPFSPLGEGIDLAAPGVDVLAIGPWTALRISGTSPAAAIGAAAAARASALVPGGDVAERRAALLAATRPPRDPSLEGEVGAGVIDFDLLR